MPLEKLQPFHKSVVYHIANASKQELEFLARMIHTTQIPINQAEILKAWKLRCKETGSPDHGVTKRLTS